MHSYAIFTTKKGRPRVVKDCHSEKKSSDSEVITSLFYLKKITLEQMEAARYYESVSARYYSSIGCPTSYSSVLARVEETKTFKHATKVDEIIFLEWKNIRQALHKVNPVCEELLHRVIIENKLKYELLNPVNISQNLLKILQNGLDQIRHLRLRASL